MDKETKELFEKLKEKHDVESFEIFNEIETLLGLALSDLAFHATMYYDNDIKNVEKVFYDIKDIFDNVFKSVFDKIAVPLKTNPSETVIQLSNLAKIHSPETADEIDDVTLKLLNSLKEN